MALANAFVADPNARDEARYPLDVVFCEACSLVQITETVPPEILFRDYAYFSSFSDSMLESARRFAECTSGARKLDKNSLVVEIGSNDGYLLRFFRKRGIKVLGVEPARNIAKVARERGIPTETEFFGKDSAQKLLAMTGGADLVVANNVLAHQADLSGFVEGIRLLLKPGGVASIEVPYLKDMIDRTEFDTIYHEHLCYFSFAALCRLLSLKGLTVNDVEQLPIHGGSLRLTVGGTAPPSPAVEALRESERAWNVGRAAAYSGFSNAVEALRDRLRSMLLQKKANGASLAAYGAAAKGTVLLNYCALDTSVIDFVADRSPHKQGKHVPGVHVPILPPDELLRRQPDYTVLLSWNVAEEVMAQQTEYLHRGGKFVIPIPDPKVVPA